MMNMKNRQQTRPVHTNEIIDCAPLLKLFVEHQVIIKKIMSYFLIVHLLWLLILLFKWSTSYELKSYRCPEIFVRNLEVSPIFNGIYLRTVQRALNYSCQRHQKRYFSNWDQTLATIKYVRRPIIGYDWILNSRACISMFYDRSVSKYFVLRFHEIYILTDCRVSVNPVQNHRSSQRAHLQRLL